MNSVSKKIIYVFVHLSSYIFKDVFLKVEFIDQNS